MNKDFKLRSSIYYFIKEATIYSYDEEDTIRLIQREIFAGLTDQEKRFIREENDPILRRIVRHEREHIEKEIRSPNCNLCQMDVSDYFGIEWESESIGLTPYDWLGIMQQFWADRGSLIDPKGWPSVISY